MESISAFEIIKIGIGPSSSHTMGPWRAASQFLAELPGIESVASVTVRLYGSLAKTGKGHGTDVAILMGLSGEDYTSIDTGTIADKVGQITRDNRLHLGGKKPIPFRWDDCLVFDYETTLPRHANAMRFEAIFGDGASFERVYYSLGGGFIAGEADAANPAETRRVVTPHPCHTGADLISNCRSLGLSVSELTYLNERAWRSKPEIDAQALLLWREIQSCIFRGVNSEGYLPGGLNVRRRSAEINRKLLGATVYRSMEE